MSNTAIEIIELREELQRTKLLLQNCNGDIVRADRELASLREQLKLSKEIGIERGKQLKQQEEVIRELIPIAEKCLRTFQYDNLKIKDFVNGMPSDQSDAIKAIIEKAKSLTTKDK